MGERLSVCKSFRMGSTFQVVIWLPLLIVAVFTFFVGSADGLESEPIDESCYSDECSYLFAQADSETKVYVDLKGIYHFDWFHATQVTQSQALYYSSMGYAIPSGYPRQMTYGEALRKGHTACSSCRESSSSGSSHSSSSGLSNSSSFGPLPSSSSEGSMFRLYNPNSGEHFYTADRGEGNHLASIGWNYEGIGWTAPLSSNTPVYRMYNPYAGEHHYCTDPSEKDGLVKAGWNYEGIGWYSDDAMKVPLYRDYNPNQFSNNHNYTTDISEHEYLVSLGWNPEGIAWYGM